MGTVTVSGTKILLDGKPYHYQGLSFFNALYNSAFNESDDAVARWLGLFKSWGITALRIWGDWRTQNGWIDEGPEASLWIYPVMEGRNRLYEPEGLINGEALERLERLLTLADERAMVIEIALFTHYMVYPVRMRDDCVEKITLALKPWRNCIFQIWNEYDDHVLRHVDTIKALDPERLTTNSPGGASQLGHRRDNSALDLLTPHTFRRGSEGVFWQVAPAQIKALIETYHKPVIDDEPARTGIRDFGGTPDSRIEQHIAHIDQTLANGGYHHYHHDMFQCGYGAPSTPPDGIPDPTFSAFHRPIFEHLRAMAPAEVRGA